MKRRATWMAALLVSTISTSAWAQTYYTSVGTPEQITVRPRGVLEVQGGVGGWTGNLSRVGTAGASYQVRAGVELLPWLGFDLNYTGMYTGTRPEIAGSGVHLASNGFFGSVRFIAPLWRVMPYAFVGVGYAHTSVVSDSTAQATTLWGAGRTIVPFGLGVNFALTHNLLVGVEGTYEPNVSNTTLMPSNPELGRGDSWNAVLSLAYRTF